MAIGAVRELAGSADERLVLRARAGDADAFEALVATRVDRCYRLAWTILGNDEDAADATQEGFVAAWRQLPRLRDIAAFDGWLNRIVPTRRACRGGTASGCARCRPSGTPTVQLR